VTKDLTKKAAEMLLKGATLLSEPCPYCSGVRVMKEGHALCISCGREPESKTIQEKKPTEMKKSLLEETLDKKIESLLNTKLQEKDHDKQQEILKSINSVLETIQNIKYKQ
jgi:UPF0148 protein